MLDLGENKKSKILVKDASKCDQKKSNKEKRYQSLLNDKKR